MRGRADAGLGTHQLLPVATLGDCWEPLKSPQLRPSREGGNPCVNLRNSNLDSLLISFRKANTREVRKYENVTNP